MTVKINENYNHIFRHSKYRNDTFQSTYIVFDVETNEKKINESQKELTFRMISYYFIEDFEVVKKGVTDNLESFWFDFYNFIENKQLIICFNNNMGFDIRASKGFKYLDWFGFKPSKNFYMKNRTLILPFERIENNQKYQILFLDMQNYFPYKSIKEFGETINLEKLEIDFDDCTDEELEIYALRDVEIAWTFFKYFINFLRDNELVSRLKPTLSSLALSTYRTKFHKNIEIFIHNCLTATKLEKEAYRGGISDVFLKDVEIDECYYVDINSFYAFIMKYRRLPTKLIANLFSYSSTQRKLRYYLNKCIKSEKYLCIANINYSLHQGYLLNKKNETTCNVHGDNIEGSFCQPELEYVINNGKILKINQICIYECDILFDEYIDFFYAIKKESSGVVRWFTKRFLTNLYGKWGQLKEEMKMLTKKELIKYYDIIEENKDLLIDENQFSHIASIVGDGEIYKIGKKLYIQKRKKTKAFDAFIAISSFVTSYCRTYLIKLKEITEGESKMTQENLEKAKFKELVKLIDVYYCDTDSLFVSKKGFDRLKQLGYIGEELGQLKNELGQDEFGNERYASGIFHVPKDYEFDNKIKCKGIKKKAKQLNENTYLVEEFESLHKAIKNGNLDRIIITEKEKVMKREYKKGIVLPNGLIKVFVV